MPPWFAATGTKSQPAPINGSRDEPRWAHRLYTISVSLLVLTTVLYSLLLFLFLPRAADVDDMGLFNPVYMKLRHGRMTYPVHGQYSTMTIHPPVKYQEVALLMQLGLSLFHAESAGVFLLTVFVVWVIATGRFSSSSKLGLLLGFSAAFVFMSQIYHHIQGIRPDIQLALAWLLGLLLLEDGRLRDWDLKRLGAGAFVLTYASALHYYGTPACLGLGWYAWQARVGLPPGRFKRVAAALLAGAGLFGIPHLVLFVIPDFRFIIGCIAQVQPGGSPWAAITAHFQQYTFWRNVYAPPSSGPVLYYVLYPLLYLKIPLFLPGLMGLLLRKDTRVLGVAALPLCLFVFAGVHRKWGQYLLPELMVFFAGGAIGLVLVLAGVARRLAGLSARAITAATMAGVTAGITWLGNPALGRIKLRPPVHEMEMARAAAKEIVGEEALIGGRIGVWYASGAARWHDIAPDLLWQSDISAIDLREYFGQFDYLAEHGHMSDVTVNSRLESIPSWYASGVLHLAGFFLGVSHPHGNILWLRPAPADRIHGFAWTGDKLLKFSQEEGGEHGFVACLCPMESYPPINKWRLPRFNALYLPKVAPSDPSRSQTPAARPSDPRWAVVTSLLSRGEFQTRRAALSAECKILDLVWGRLSLASHEALLKKLRETDGPIRFYRSLDEAIVPRLSTIGTGRAIVSLENIQLAYAGAAIRGTTTKTVVTAPQPWSYAASIPISPRHPAEGGWVHVRARVLSGQAGFGVLDREQRKFLSREFRERSQASQTIYLRVRAFQDACCLMVQNGAYRGSSHVVLEEVGALLPTAAKTAPR